MLPSCKIWHQLARGVARLSADFVHCLFACNESREPRSINVFFAQLATCALPSRARLYCRLPCCTREILCLFVATRLGYPAIGFITYLYMCKNVIWVILVHHPAHRKLSFTVPLLYPPGCVAADVGRPPVCHHGRCDSDGARPLARPRNTSHRGPRWEGLYSLLSSFLSHFCLLSAIC
jgi:hypothetical protein